MPAGCERPGVRVETKPNDSRLAASNRERAGGKELPTRIRLPSKPIEKGELNPLPVRVLRSAPSLARTTETLPEFGPAFVTQRFRPSNVNPAGKGGSETDRAT